MFKQFLLLATLLTSSVVMQASVFGSIRAIVHDPQHRAIANAEVLLESTNSSLKLTGHTDARGVAQFLSVPIGEYQISASAAGFAVHQQVITAISDRVQELHVQLRMQDLKQSIEVQDSVELVNPSSSTPQSMIDRVQIAETPGADRTNSLSFITDYVPAAYMVQQQLHVRSGHQITWAFDGVPVPNTNIASNVG